MKTGTKVVWVGAVLLVLCITSNVTAEKIITSPDWADPFVAGELIVVFTEEAIERIAHAFEQGVEEGQLIAVPHSTGSIYKAQADCGLRGCIEGAIGSFSPFTSP